MASWQIQPPADPAGRRGPADRAGRGHEDAGALRRLELDALGATGRVQRRSEDVRVQDQPAALRGLVAALARAPGVRQAMPVASFEQTATDGVTLAVGSGREPRT